MTSLAVPVHAELEHLWELRVEDFEEGHAVRTFECVDCGAVRFE